MKFKKLANNYKKGDTVKSLDTGEKIEYSGYFKLVGTEPNAIGSDTYNRDLILFQNGELAEIIKKM
jgi:hypothetical protein